jgi:hypothetical protein
MPSLLDIFHPFFAYSSGLEELDGCKVGENSMNEKVAG